jgi:excisionase family DNA binding protein
MGAKVRVQLGLSTAVYTIARPANPDPGGPLNLSTVVHAPGLTLEFRRRKFESEVKTMEGARLMKVADAARLLGVSRAHVYKLAHAGVLRLLKLGPQASRIPADDVEKLAREGVPRAVIQLLRRRGGGGRER